MDATRVVFPERGTVALEHVEVPPVGPAQVLVRTRWSLISSGTERIALFGRFDPGTQWERYARLPFHPGYSNVGDVVAVGEEVSDLAVGDVVATRAAHVSQHVADALRCTKVPEGVDPRDATWFALAKIAFVGVRAGDPRLGARVLTVGAGPVGQMAVRWVNALGALSNAVIDPVESRREHARRGGATAAAGVDLDDHDAVLALCGGVAPDVVIDSTGNAAVLEKLLSIVAVQGCVVLLGNTGNPEALRLTEDLLSRSVRIHGAHERVTFVDSDWDGDRSLHGLFFHLAASTNRFSLDGLVTSAFAPGDAAAAYDTLERNPHADLGVVFDWRDSR